MSEGGGGGKVERLGTSKGEKGNAEGLGMREGREEGGLRLTEGDEGPGKEG